MAQKSISIFLALIITFASLVEPATDAPKYSGTQSSRLSIENHGNNDSFSFKDSLNQNYYIYHNYYVNERSDPNGTLVGKIKIAAKTIGIIQELYSFFQSWI